MKKVFNLMLLCVAIMSFSSCSKGDSDDQEEPYFQFTGGNETISSEGGTINKYIYSNVYWYVSSDEYYNWIKITPTSGEGDQTLQITVSPNETQNTRTAHFELYSYNEHVSGFSFSITQKGGNGNSTISAPTGVSSNLSGSYVNITWNSVSGATKYNVYRSSSYAGNYTLISTVTGYSAMDYSPLSGYNYYKVTAHNGYNESGFSTYTYTYVSSGNGGNGGGGGTQTAPSAPTGVTVSNEGNAYLPMVAVRWNSVSGATKYYVYRSTTANGTYSKIGETTYNVYNDTNAPTNGGSAYYKVKAVNNYGTSEYSSYAQYKAISNDDAFAPVYKYGSCTCSGNTITLRWTHSTGQGYGKATKVVLRVWNPYLEEWQDTELSTTQTSVSFNYATKVDNDGFVKAGIVVSNAKGSFTAGSKVYDAYSKKWIN